MKKIKFNRWILPFALILALALLTACNPAAKLEKALSLSEPNLTLMVGTQKRSR